MILFSDIDFLTVFFGIHQKFRCGKPVIYNTVRLLYRIKSADGNQSHISRSGSGQQYFSCHLPADFCCRLFCQCFRLSAFHTHRINLFSAVFSVDGMQHEFLSCIKNLTVCSDRHMTVSADFFQKCPLRPSCKLGIFIIQCIEPSVQFLIIFPQFQCQDSLCRCRYHLIPVKTVTMFRFYSKPVQSRCRQNDSVQFLLFHLL